MEISSDENILLTLGWRFLIIKFRSSVAAHQILFFLFFLYNFSRFKAFGGFSKFPNDFFQLSIIFIVIVVRLLFLFFRSGHLACRYFHLS